MCTRDEESYLNRFHLILCWLGVIGTRAKRLFRKSCFCDNYIFQAARRISWKFIVNSCTRSFRVRVTESGPKPRDHSIPLLETEKIMLLHCRLKVIKLGMELIFRSTISINGELTLFCHKKKKFCLYWCRLGCGWLWLAKIFFKIEVGFHFCSHDLSFWQNKLCHQRQTK